MHGSRRFGGNERARRFPSGQPVLKLSLAGVRASRARFASLTFAIFIGVSFIAATLTITDTVQSGFNSLFGNAYRNVSVAVRQKSAVIRQQQTFRGRIDAGVADSVSHVPGVAAVSSRIVGYAYVVSLSGVAPENVVSDTAGAPIAENWITDPTLNPYQILEGTQPSRSGEVVIDRATAKGATIAVGDPVTVVSKNGSTPARVVGVVRFGAVDSPGGAPVVLFSDAEATALLGESGRIDGVIVRSDHSVSDSALAERVQKALPAGVEAVTGKTATKESEDSVKSSLRFFTAFLLIFAILALVVGAFIIANTFAMSISQRTRDLALLRAVGGSRSQIRRMVLGEAFIMSLAGSVLGLTGGIAMASALRTLLRTTGVDLPPSPLIIRAPTILWGGGIGIVVTFAAALVPALRASSVAPVAAMRDNEFEPKPLWLRTTIGAVASVVGAFLMKSGADAPELARTGQGIALLFLGALLVAPALSTCARVLVGPLRRMFGITAGLAARNATRNPRRTASTALALSLGSAVACFAVILNASLQSSLTSAIAGGLRGDLVVRSGSFGIGGLPITLAGRIAALPGVEAASGLRYGFATVDGPKRKPRHPSAVSRTGGRPIASVDPLTADRLLDFGLEKGRFGDLGKGTIALSQRELDDHGWLVGDTLELGFPGRKAAPFIISTAYRQGIAFDFAIGHADYEKEVADPFDFVVYIAARSGVNVEILRTEVRRALAAYPTAKVENPSEYVARLTNSLDQLLSLIVGLLVLVVVVAVLGIAITLSLSVVERVREIGLLRTLGMPRSQVRSMLRSEAIIISVFAVFIGVVLGTGSAWALLRALRGEGLTSFVFPALSVSLLAVLAAVAGLVAAIVPGRRAARLPVLSALVGSRWLPKLRGPTDSGRSPRTWKVGAIGVVGLSAAVALVGFGLRQPSGRTGGSTGPNRSQAPPSRAVSVESATIPAASAAAAVDPVVNRPYPIPSLDGPIRPRCCPRRRPHPAACAFAVDRRLGPLPGWTRCPLRRRTGLLVRPGTRTAGRRRRGASVAAGCAGRRCRLDPGTWLRRARRQGTRRNRSHPASRRCADRVGTGGGHAARHAVLQCSDRQRTQGHAAQTGAASAGVDCRSAPQRTRPQSNRRTGPDHPGWSGHPRTAVDVGRPGRPVERPRNNGRPQGVPRRHPWWRRAHLADRRARLDDGPFHRSSSRPLSPTPAINAKVAGPTGTVAAAWAHLF
jgi:putative ABC transport system permease protein